VARSASSKRETATQRTELREKQHRPHQLVEAV